LTTVPPCRRSKLGKRIPPRCSKHQPPANAMKKIAGPARRTDRCVNSPPCGVNWTTQTTARGWRCGCNLMQPPHGGPPATRRHHPPPSLAAPWHLGVPLQEAPLLRGSSPSASIPCSTDGSVTVAISSSSMMGTDVGTLPLRTKTSGTPDSSRTIMTSSSK